MILHDTVTGPEVGFTGTAHGMTHPQAAAVQHLLQQALRRGATTLHHGQCVGADAEAHRAATALGMWTHAHPANDVAQHKVASLVATFHSPPMPALRRNRVIVRESGELIAAPRQMQEVNGRAGGGTWATVRYARLASIPISIAWPDGSTTREEFE